MRQLGCSLGAFEIGQVVGQAVKRRIDLATAVRSKEPAVGKWLVGHWQAQPTVRLQGRKTERRFERLLRQVLVGVSKAGFIKTHGPGQFAKDLRIGFGLAHRRNGRLVQRDPGVAVAGVHVQVFELGGGGQHVVGKVGGVGQKMFKHHGEKVGARKTLHHLARLRRHRHRVAVVDHHGLNARAKGAAVFQDVVGVAQQVASDGAHIDRARLATAQKIRALQGDRIDRRLCPARCREQQASASMPPCPHQTRQQRNQAHCIAAAARALHAVVQPNRRALRAAISLCKPAHIVGADSAHLGYSFRWPGQGLGAQGLEAARAGLHIRGDVVGIQPIVRDQFVHQP